MFFHMSGVRVSHASLDQWWSDEDMIMNEASITNKVLNKWYFGLVRSLGKSNLNTLYLQ